MSSFEKLQTRFLSIPKDFTYDELKRLLSGFGYEEQQRSGSRVVFKNERLHHNIKLHKPHPGNILKRYQLNVILKELKIKGLL
jgi:predicted RNA binding protein YcfA (HicA-like mRNA interferase family)